MNPTVFLPGPILTVQHRVDAIRQVVAELRRLAKGRRHHRPETWVSIAQALGIVCRPYHQPGQSAGRLIFDHDADTWVIIWNTARSRAHQAATLVHELAHWFFREARGEWLCGEPVVYFYEGPVEDEQHKLADDVERLIVQVWDEVPPVGLFFFDTEQT